jgi:phosphate:Na+ symporter
MVESISVIGKILGGLGLFLLAVGMMTDGLKLAAGNSLRKVLAQWTSTPLRGVLSGFTMTAIVQSSSAITVASIGFVNAGLLTMRQALGIVYGANVGTTVTGWLVALLGFKLDIQAFAIPLIGIGMLMRFTKQEGRLASLGLAIVGFGLFFVGIDVLKTAFESLVLAFDITKFTADGLLGVILFLVIGILMTILTQSSSASIALTITAASSGLVGLYAACAMVIGANVGTTSTAVIASIGATSHAKRVAFAQVLFNVGTGVIALSILPLLFFAVEVIREFLGLSAEPSVLVALFHTVFNVLGVLLVLPFNRRIAAFLDKQFLTAEEIELRLKFLDKTIAQTPVLAVNAIILELESMAEKVSYLSRSVIARDKAAHKSVKSEDQVIKFLSAEISKFIVGLERKALSEDTINQLATLLRVEQYFYSCSNLAINIYKRRDALEDLNAPALDQAMKEFLGLASRYLQYDFSARDSVGESLEEKIQKIQIAHDKLKATFLLAGTLEQISIEKMLELIEFIAEQLRISQQWFKAINNLNRLRQESGTEKKHLGEGKVAWVDQPSKSVT